MDVDVECVFMRVYECVCVIFKIGDGKLASWLVGWLFEGLFEYALL